jgi:uncharacterized protein YjbI with pentapeptide repeats
MMALTGVIGVVILLGLTPETAALITAWTTIVGVVIAQFVNGRLAGERAQIEELRAYFETMRGLLTDNRQTDSAQGLTRALARAQTATILRGLDPNRKRVLLQFLYESELIEDDNPFVDLTRADLHRANLQGSFLSGANLQEANLQEANLQEANLQGAKLVGAALVGADLRGADLRASDLRKTILLGTDLRKADLREADLRGAFLFFVALKDTNLKGADLRESDLSGGTVEGTPIWQRSVRTYLAGKIERAIGDRTTKLPDYLQHPKSWSKSTDEPPNQRSAGA